MRFDSVTIDLRSSFLSRMHLHGLQERKTMSDTARNRDSDASERQSSDEDSGALNWPKSHSSMRVTI